MVLTPPLGCAGGPFSSQGQYEGPDTPQWYLCYSSARPVISDSFALASVWMHSGPLLTWPASARDSALACRDQ